MHDLYKLLDLIFKAYYFSQALLAKIVDGASLVTFTSALRIPKEVAFLAFAWGSPIHAHHQDLNAIRYKLLAILFSN